MQYDKQLHKMTRQLFEAVHGIGEVLKGEIHIIDTSGADENKRSYRVYHKTGFCFDVRKEYICKPGETDKFDTVLEDGFSYSFFAEWDGFLPLTERAALLIIRAFANENNGE